MRELDENDTPLWQVRILAHLQGAMNEFHEKGGFHHPPWVHWVLTPGNKAGGYFTLPSTWDAQKLERVRELLRDMRLSFRRHSQRR